MLLHLIARVLLWTFPKPFRDRLGRPMLQTLLADARTPSGRLSLARLAVGAVDVTRAGLAERVAASRRRRRPAPRRTWADALWSDVRYSLRRLWHARGFTLAAVLTLAAAIGVNTAIFQLLDAVRLRALPVRSAAELAEIRIANVESRRGNVSVWHAGATNAIWEQIRARQEAFSGVFAWSSGGMRLTADGVEPRFASALLVSGEFFDVLGVQPALGRLISRQDDVRGCMRPAVVLSHAFWQREFHGSPNILGQTIALGRSSYAVVGVAAREFTGLDVGRRFDVAVPLCAEWLPAGSFSRLDSGVDWFLIVMGRLKPGWTRDGASEHLAAISPAVFKTSLPPNYPPENVGQYLAYRLTAIDASRGISILRGQYTSALWFLQATAFLVLIAGCTNVATLMLARAAAREREIAARLALGAARGQILRMVLTDALALSVAGGALGTWLAGRLSAGLVGFLDGGANSLFLSLPLDWRTLAFCFGTTLGTCLVCGLAPAWRASRLPIELVLRATARGLTEARGGMTTRRLLITSQVGLSFVLLSAALLFTRSLGNLTGQNIGLRPDGLTIAYVDMSGARVQVEQRAAFKHGMMQQLTETPGVLAVAETSVVPLSGGASDNDVWIEGAPLERSLALFMETSDGYFQTVGTPLVAGRTFDERRDTPDSPPVALVNDAFVRKFLAGGNPVGRRLWREARPETSETAYEIVGLVSDAKYQHLRQEFRPTVYVATSQNPRPSSFAQLLIRTSMPEPEVVPALKATFTRVSPGIVPTFQDFRTMVDRTLVQDQLLAGLSLAFGALAALLAAVGLYGSMAFAVAHRTKEIGLRLALGADRRRILFMILRDAGKQVAIGCVAGAILTFWLGGFVGTLLYDLEPRDPASRLAAALLILVIAFAAAIVPARRAAGLDPIVACRTE